MNTKLLTSFVCLLSSVAIYAQQEQTPIYYDEYGAKNKIHFSDKTKVVELPGKMEAIDYSDGVFILKENQGSNEWGQWTYRWHIVDTTGVFLAKNLDWDGTPFRLPVFDKGYAVNHNKGLTIIDKKGKTVCDLYKTFAITGEYFVDGLVLAAGKSFREGGEEYHKVSYIGADGKIKFPNLTVKVSSWDIFSGLPEVAPLKEGLRRHYDFKTKKYGFINEQGAYVAKPQFLKAHDFCEGLAAVKVATDDGEKWGFIGKDGKMVIEAKFGREPGDFHNGYSVLTKNNGWKTLLKPDGTIMNMNCQELLDFNGGFSFMRTGEGKQYILNKALQGLLVWASRSQISIGGFEYLKNIQEKSLRYDKDGIYSGDFFPLLYPDYGWFSYLGDGFFWYENQAAGGESGVIRADGERVMVFRVSEW